MHRILFVCHGNICRSPMAEFVLKELVRRAGLAEAFVIDSQACRTDEIGSDTHPGTQRVLRAHGIPFMPRQARQIRRDDYAQWDYIIGMEKLNMSYMLRILGGDPEGKVKLLMDFTGTPEDIDDPWYTGDFGGVYRQIVRGCEALLRGLGY